MLDSPKVGKKEDFAAFPRKILLLFGTRPEIIKLAPVISRLQSNCAQFQTVIVSSGQHKELLAPFAEMFRLKSDYELRIMTEDQTPSEILCRVVTALQPILRAEKPDCVVVQGDTTTALAGALAASYEKIAVAHVEAGLRSDNRFSPFPEELNRRMIAPLADIHFAATPRNKRRLLAEGVAENRIFVTGNTIVDALQNVLQNVVPDEKTQNLLEKLQGFRIIVLTTHRRENFGTKMRENLTVLRDFVRENEKFALIFPVHPNPSVRDAAREVFQKEPRVHLIEPLCYMEFIALMKAAELIVSDSGGIQEETPTLRKKLIILRENTERPEAVEAGFAKLAVTPADLKTLLDECLNKGGCFEDIETKANPFGDGTAAKKIAEILAEFSLHNR